MTALANYRAKNMAKHRDKFWNIQFYLFNIVKEMKYAQEEISKMCLRWAFFMAIKTKDAILVEGPKWCGKTSTAEQVSNSVLYMQDPSTRSQNLRLAEIAPQQLLQGSTPRLIDEWQEAPQLWDAVRFEVDQRDEFGQFILTGSSVPSNINEIRHTGTGRIARMRMRPCR